MIHELVFAYKPLSFETARTVSEVAKEARRALVSRNIMSSEITLVTIIFGAVGVGTSIAWDIG